MIKTGSEILVFVLLTSQCFPACSANPTELTCEDIENARLLDGKIIEAPVPPSLKGKWVSQECETRPGPEYILRNYHFMRNSSFMLYQYYYGDESCTLPLYGIVARGHLKLMSESWITPGGTHAEYFLHNVAVIPYSVELAQELSRRINITCPNYVTKLLTPHDLFVIYSYREEQKSDEFGMTVDILEDFDCLDSVYLSFHELQLLRVEDRPERADKVTSELFLGDLPLGVEHRSLYRPTSYQVPLVKWQKQKDCHVCHLVAKAQPQAPTHLNAKPKLPVNLAGKWISTRCETRPYGMFLTRRLLFRGDGMWQGYYRYFSDPICNAATFSLVIQGRYNLGVKNNTHQEGPNFNFTIQRVILIPQNPSIVKNLNSHKPGECGDAGTWELLKPQDITKTGGCVGMGVRVPDTVQDIIKMEVNHVGYPLLYIGQTSDDKSYRPSSYELPLRKCHSKADPEDQFTPFLDADVNRAIPVCPTFTVILIVMVISFN